MSAGATMQGPSLLLDDNTQGDPPYVGQMRYDAGAWRQRDAQGVYNARSAYLLSHETQALLSHYVQEWANAGGFRVVTGAPYPSQVTWYTDTTMAKMTARTQYVRNTLQQATQVVYQVFATDGATVVATATDTITYSGANETSRTRVLS